MEAAEDADPCIFDLDELVDAKWLQKIGVDPSLFGKTEERSKLKKELTTEVLGAGGGPICCSDRG